MAGPYKWNDGKKWDKRAGKFKHVCRLGPSIAIVTALHGIHNRTEWRMWGEVGYADSVEDAKGVIFAMRLARRMIEGGAR